MARLYGIHAHLLVEIALAVCVELRILNVLIPPRAHFLAIAANTDRSRSIPLLKVNSGGDYDAFLALAASIYAKMQAIEACVLPECTKRRLAMRDVMVKDSVCGIAGLEEFLFAITCTITREYYPDLHR